MTRKQLYHALAIVGTVIPWLFFGSFFSSAGATISLFVRSLFVNGAAGGFTVDLLLSISIFWFWSFFGARERGIRRCGIKRWWLMLPAASFVGLSLALPLYLREGAHA